MIPRENHGNGHVSHRSYPIKCNEKENIFQNCNRSNKWKERGEANGFYNNGIDHVIKRHVFLPLLW